MSNEILSDDDVRIYCRVGKIVHDVLEYAKTIVKPGVKVLEICEKIEQKIIEHGAQPAFPTNISINNVAAP